MTRILRRHLAMKSLSEYKYSSTLGVKIGYPSDWHAIRIENSTVVFLPSLSPFSEEKQLSTPDNTIRMQ